MKNKALINAKKILRPAILQILGLCEPKMPSRCRLFVYHLQKLYPSALGVRIGPNLKVGASASHFYKKPVNV